MKPEESKGACKYSPWPFSDWPLLTALRSIETSADGGAGGGPSASRCWTHPRAEAPFPSPAPGEFARLERGAPAPNGVGCCQARRRLERGRGHMPELDSERFRSTPRTG